MSSFTQVFSSLDTWCCRFPLHTSVRGTSSSKSCRLSASLSLHRQHPPLHTSLVQQNILYLSHLNHWVLTMGSGGRQQGGRLCDCGMPQSWPPQIPGGHPDRLGSRGIVVCMDAHRHALLHSALHPGPGRVRSLSRRVILSTMSSLGFYLCAFGLMAGIKGWYELRAYLPLHLKSHPGLHADLAGPHPAMTKHFHPCFGHRFGCSSNRRDANMLARSGPCKVCGVQLVRVSSRLEDRPVPCAPV